MGINPTIKEIVALLCSDIDIFLLREEDQSTDKDQTYTAEEVRAQLLKTSHKLLKVLGQYGVDTDRRI